MNKHHKSIRLLGEHRKRRVRRYNPECVAFVEKLPIIKQGHESVGRKRIPREWKRKDGRVIAPK
jgi:hypothetical protein